MDGFAIVVVAGLVVVVMALLVIERAHPGSGADILDWRPTRSVEAELELELDDVEQMLEAQNRRRRARGEPELTEDDIQDQVLQDRREAQRRSAAYRAARARGSG